MVRREAERETDGVNTPMSATGAVGQKMTAETE
jgi:hypothetical protein